MDILNISGYTIRNLGKINIILGKNGCGKSTLIRNVEAGIPSNQGAYGKNKYITPERGGNLVYDAGIEQNLSTNQNYMSGTRRRNQAENFRQQSIAQYKSLEILVLREIEGTKRKEFDYSFDVYVKKINSLLDNIEIRRIRDNSTFKIYKKGTDFELSATDISSGESELISLGIECLVFSKECEKGKENILFLDEPDVHLHPDLQVRLMHFLKELVSENIFRVIIATHSTAILGALETSSDTHLAFLIAGQKDLEFQPISEVYRKVLPVFGAHPLSNIFNQAPILLLEGEDDERIWQQAVRSSRGKMRVYPCSVESVTNMNKYERETAEIIKSVYDKGKGFSLRDRDGIIGDIDDLGPIVRMKLSCRNAENLLLADETLAILGINWEDLKGKIGAWIQYTPHTQNHHSIMKDFVDGNFDRKSFDLKDLRNDLMAIIGSPKPWEVAVGVAVSRLQWDEETDFNKEGKLISFLGEKVAKNLIPKK